MPNKPLLRTTMGLVEASDNHDNQWFAFRRKDEPGSETYCFATMAIFVVHPEAQPIWNIDVDGCQFAMKVRLPDGTEHVIEDLAAELLDMGRDGRLFGACETKASLREMVEELAG